MEAPPSPYDNPYQLQHGTAPPTVPPTIAYGGRGYTGVGQPVYYPPPGGKEGGMINPMGVPAPPPTEDHPDLYISEEVKHFLPYFAFQIAAKNVGEILTIYDNEFNRLSDRFFKEFPWPEADRVAQLIPRGNESTAFLILYKELRYRHIYAKHTPTLANRFESYSNYIDLFDMILNNPGPLDIDLPNQWLWDIVDEFIYQFQTFVQFRGKLTSRSAEEIQMLRNDERKAWNIHSVLNVLYSLVQKSRIKEQLEVVQAGGDPDSVAGEFGSHPLYKNIGYFSLIGLLRLHTQLGDYHTALESVANIQLSKKVLATTRVPASMISLYYHAGFCRLMMRQYRDTVRVFSNIIVFVQRVKQHFTPKSYQHDLVLKQNDQMLAILAMVLALYPQHVDELVTSQLRDRRFQEDITKLQKGDVQTFKKLFMASCPKFISPVPPDYDALPENYNKAPTDQQCAVFLRELEPQLKVPVVRSYLKFYTTMPVSKLASFLEGGADEEAVCQYLLRFKHLSSTILPAVAGQQADSQAVSDIDFYIDQGMIHIADTKVARRYGDYFLRQINKLQDLMGSRP